jgi:putative hydrolase of HD superfamily
MLKIDTQRLDAQLSFFREVDKLKQVFRQTLLLDSSRCENDAEHSWHLAMMVLAFKEYAPAPIDIGKVLKLVILHDLVEIDAGDVYTYDEFDPAVKEAKEQAGADRIFYILPADQGSELMALWHEYEDKQTPESLFASAMDKLQPFLHNYYADTAAWRLHDVPKKRVIEKMSIIQRGAPALWPMTLAMIEQADEEGLFADSPGRQRISAG